MPTPPTHTPTVKLNDKMTSEEMQLRLEYACYVKYMQDQGIDPIKYEHWIEAVEYDKKLSIAWSHIRD
jgi:hypothetical protein